MNDVIKKIVVTAVVALALHVTMGWAWTLLAGVLAGLWHPHRGWLVGGAGVGVAWAVLVGYNFVAAWAATQRMATTVGGLLGNMPSVAVVGLSLFIGLALGGLGGGLGAQMARTRAHRRRAAP